MTGLLGIPVGVPGAGRARYGRAMALYAAGRVSAAQLEVYRVAAADDRGDPAPLFAERALPLPPDPPAGDAAVLRALIDEADLYLAGLPGPGVAEARAGIAAWRDGPAAAAANANPVATAHLPAALDALRPAHPGLAVAIALAAPLLPWVTYDAYPRAEIGAAFATAHAFAPIIGPTAPVPAQDFELGLFVIAPHVLYRDRCHPAPELYAPLTGPHGWRFGPGLPLTVKPAHQPVWNPPDRPHATKVGPLPFLCLYVWTRDVALPARVIPADDWPVLEALHLDP